MAIDYSNMTEEILLKAAELKDPGAIEYLAQKKLLSDEPLSQTEFEKFADANQVMQKVVVGKVTVEDFFSDDKYQDAKDGFIKTIKEKFPDLSNSKFGIENVAAAWITKNRFNDDITDNQFLHHMKRSEEIFFVKLDDELSLDLTNPDPNKNDNIAMSWGMEALNGVQSMDSGATRIRLAEGVGPKIYDAYKVAGAKQRASTHAVCTKLEDGLGKDIVNESDRKFTPRGTGTILMIATSKDGSAKKADFDLLLKREDYGFKDKLSHSIRHGLGGLKKLVGYNNLINKKSKITKKYEETHGKGKKTHRKDHLSELKGEAAILLSLLKAGKDNNIAAFNDFQTKTCIRIAIPPFEKKIISASKEKPKLALSDFIKVLSEHKNELAAISPEVKQKLDSIAPLLARAKTATTTYEGDEVRSNLSGGRNELDVPICPQHNEITLDEQAQLEREGILTRTAEVDDMHPDTVAILNENPEARQLVALASSAELRQQGLTSKETTADDTIEPDDTRRLSM